MRDAGKRRAEKPLSCIAVYGCVHACVCRERVQGGEDDRGIRRGWELKERDAEEKEKTAAATSLSVAAPLRLRVVRQVPLAETGGRGALNKSVTRAQLRAAFRQQVEQVTE